MNKTANKDTVFFHIICTLLIVLYIIRTSGSFGFIFLYFFVNHVMIRKKENFCGGENRCKNYYVK